MSNPQENIFIVSTPLEYSIPLPVTNLHLATVTVDQTYFTPSAWSIQFSGTLTTISNISETFNCTFSLFQVNETQPIKTFNLISTLDANTPQTQSVFFEYMLDSSLVSTKTQYELQLNSIDASSTATFTISSGTLIGLSIPL